MFNHMYPGTDLHEIDLEYVMQQIRALNEKMSSFTNANTLKFADPLQWSITTQYQANTIVNDINTGAMYLSMKPVPAGVPLTNTDYWAVLSNYQIAIDMVKTAITPIDQESSIQAITNMSDSVLFWLNDELCITTMSVNEGDTLVEGTNYDKTWIAALIWNIIGWVDGLEGRIADLESATSSLVPTDHSATALTYGGGISTKYGHVKVSDNISTSAGNASQSVAASSKAVKDVYDRTVTNATAASNANDNANTRVLKAGDTMTGNLTFKEDVIDKDITPGSDTNGKTIVFQDKQGDTIGFIRIYQTSGGKIGLSLRSTDGSHNNDFRLLAGSTNEIYVNNTAPWKTALGYLETSDIESVVLTGSNAISVSTGFTLNRARLIYNLKTKMAILNAVITGNTPTTMTTIATLEPSAAYPAAATDFAIGATSRYGRGNIDTSGVIQAQCNSTSTSQTMAINVSWSLA